MIDPIRNLLGTGLPSKKWQLALLICLGGVAGLSEGGSLFMLSVLVDRFGPGAAAASAFAWNIPNLEMLLAAYIALVIIMALVTRARVVVAGRLRHRAVETMRYRILSALLRMEWPALQKISGPYAVQLLTSEVTRVGMGVEFLLNITAIAVRMPFLLAVALVLSPFYAVSVLAALALFFIVAVVLNRSIRRSGELLLTAGRRMHASVDGILGGRRMVKGMNMEAAHLARFSASAREMQQTQLAQTSRIATSQAVGTVAVASMVVVGLVVAVKVFHTALADALVATLAFARLGQSGIRMHDAWRSVVLSLPAEQAIRGMIDEADRHQEPISTDIPAPVPQRAINLHDVVILHRDGQSSLRFPEVSIPVGQITVVTGPSGSGKSTLADIVMGLQAPDAGVVLVDGLPLEPATRRSWRDRVGYLPQDAFLFDQSVRENLLYACPTATEAEQWGALEKADIASIVRQMPQQMDTVVGEGGRRLSGGERQRIALARALLRNPVLLVLDEPTSALDAHSEARILRTLRQLRGGLTILVVAHRPAVIDIADHVITLSGKSENAASQNDQRL